MCRAAWAGPVHREDGSDPMYVCICNALKDSQLEAASHGARNVAEVFRRCGRRPQCGKCLPDVAQMIEVARDEDDGGTKLAAE